MITFPWFAPLIWGVAVLSVLWFLSVVGPIVFGAPWLPMPVPTARRMLQLANARPGETVYDLGSGDGRVLIVAAREFGANGVGIEIEPLRAFVSRLTFGFLRLDGRVRIVRANLFDVDLREADIVTAYLLPQSTARLAPKLRRELKPGARVATLDFHLPEWEPVIQQDNIRVYKI
jgi:SAM-dependent methyltransferase